MNLWDIFFTTQATEPPKFDLFWYVSIFTLLALTFYTAYRYREKKAYQRFFQILQAVQLILLYGWYGVNHMPLSESLPFTIAVWLCLWCFCFLVSLNIGSILHY